MPKHALGDEEVQAIREYCPRNSQMRAEVDEATDTIERISDNQ
jgi:hypothetical protein